MDTYHIPQQRYKNNINYLFDLLPEKEYKIVETMRKNADSLGDITDITRGFRPPPDDLLYDKNESNLKPLITGCEMTGAYKIGTPEKFIDYKPENIYESKPKYVFEEPKIMVRDIGLSASAYYDDSGLYCLKTIYLLRNLKRNDISLKHLTCFLNSKSTDFFFRANFWSSHIGGGYLRFRKQFLDQLPIPCKIDKKRVRLMLSMMESLEERYVLEKRILSFSGDYLSDQELSKIIFQSKVVQNNIKPRIQSTHDKMYCIFVNGGTKEDNILVDTKEKAEFVRLALKGKSVKKNETIEILVPRSNSDVKRILKEYEADKKKLEEMSTVEELEEKINQIVYDLYGMDEEDIEVVEEFLGKF